LRDRDEEEIRGYRHALTWAHDQGAKIPVSEETIFQLHRMIRDEKLPDGRSKVRFRTVTAKDTPSCIQDLVEFYDDVIKERKVPCLSC